ncbi:MAG TPA: histidine phosphatase family protein [Roseiflexaceae bacterium]|nr:histidine phosphatase family protein [Roseiflexaceae bacterium]
MTTFYLIRHGETEWNASGRWQGHADIPLNDTGRDQARQLAARLRREGVRFDAIYSSDLLRAWETAAIVGEELGMPPNALPALREIDVGAWSGLTVQEVATRDAELLARLESGEDLRRGGNGERFADLYARVIPAAEQLVKAFPLGTLALVSHGGPLRALLLYAAREKHGAPVRHLHIGNTALSVLECRRDIWELVTINDMSHLAGGPQAPDMMSAPPDDAERPL